MASSKGVDSGSVHDNADVCHVEEAPVEPYGGLFAAATALGDEEGWVQVGRDSRPDNAPSDLLQEDSLERSLSFKH